jgi:hypothetical protein
VIIAQEVAFVKMGIALPDITIALFMIATIIRVVVQAQVGVIIIK